MAEEALAVARQLASKLSLETILVRAVNLGGMLMSDVGTAYVGYESVQESLDIEASTYLDGIADILRAEGLEASTQVLEGSPGQAIGEYSDKTPGGMIVMTSHGRSGMSRWVLGSVAETVVRVSGDPVLILPPGDS